VIRTALDRCMATPVRKRDRACRASAKDRVRLQGLWFSQSQLATWNCGVDAAAGADAKVWGLQRILYRRALPVPRRRCSIPSADFIAESWLAGDAQ
jgi:hypothetical protein